MDSGLPSPGASKKSWRYATLHLNASAKEKWPQNICFYRQILIRRINLHTVTKEFHLPIRILKYDIENAFKTLQTIQIVASILYAFYLLACLFG